MMGELILMNVCLLSLDVIGVHCAPGPASYMYKAGIPGIVKLLLLLCPHMRH